MRPDSMVECEGPGLVHCYRCPPWTAACAYAALGLAVASCVYALATRCMGTPFEDALTERQREALRHDRKARCLAFAGGVAVAIALLVAWRPFARATAKRELVHEKQNNLRPTG